MKLVHVAFIDRPKIGKSTLFLRKVSENQFNWFEEKRSGDEEEIGLHAPNVEEAIGLARRTLKELGFRTLICGFRYTLPERDEHGINALFWQMAASYTAPGGVYFDEEVGHNCFVQNSSLDALKLFKQLKSQNRI
ncbi:MAG: hypothetical protein H0T62_03560 [Parachlamydiaceae bacterium]|nr:hypothetical protein [Parachlamydiaceae bacterium]